MAVLRSLRAGDGRLLDRALVLWLPGPGSYSGEDCAELHLHGGRGVLAGVVAALLDLGARPAEAGEFTRRAFLNGRMDLVEAEAIGDLVAAETEAQVQQALRQMQGALGEQYRAWSARLLRLLAGLEALIDFPDEDLPDEVAAAGRTELMTLAAEIARHLDDGGRGERLRDGLICAIIGAPNAGKSTLINSLARREVAIVAPSPGTTRDVLEARVEFGGVPVTLLDTAGLRDSSDPVEAEGVRRARALAASADIVVFVHDATVLPPAVAGFGSALVLHVANKLDLSPSIPPAWIGVSALTGAGIAGLEAALATAARDLTDIAGPAPLTRARHRAALLAARQALEAAVSAPLAELQAEEVRLAMRCIGKVVGSYGIEDILDSVFGQFCIGK